MAENGQQSPISIMEQKSLIEITHLYNPSPSKTRPWMQAAERISARNKSRGGTYDSTHGIPQGSLLVMEDASRGLNPHESVKGWEDWLS